MRRQLLHAVAVLAFALCAASPAPAQTQAKYTPDQAKALEDWTYAVALDAANWGSPAVIMYVLRANDALGSNTVSDIQRGITDVKWKASAPTGNYDCSADDMVRRVYCTKK